MSARTTWRRRWRRLIDAARAERVIQLGLAVVLVVLVVAQPAAAHVRSTTGYSAVRSDGSDVRFDLGVEFELLARSAGLGAAAVDAADDQARQVIIDDKREVVAAYLLTRRIVAAPSGQTTDPFAVLDQLSGT
jgi:hypothetical protein